MSELTGIVASMAGLPSGIPGLPGGFSVTTSSRAFSGLGNIDINVGGLTVGPEEDNKDTLLSAEIGTGSSIEAKVILGVLIMVVGAIAIKLTGLR